MSAHLFWSTLALAALVGAPLPSSAAQEGAPQPITSVERAREVCQALRPVERVRFAGTPEEAARARSAYVEAREKLRATLFSVEVPWSGFRIGEWDAEAKRLTLSTERPFSALAGAFNLVDVDRDELKLEAQDGRFDALREGLNKGTLSLLLHFRPAEADESPCVVGKADTFTFLADFERVELRGGGDAVARAVGEGFEPRPNASAGGSPTVEFAAAPLGEAAKLPRAMTKALEESMPRLLECYRQALQRAPGLDGSLILQLGPGDGGALETKQVMADSLLDPAALDCVKAALAAARAQGAASGAVLLKFEPK